MVEIIQIIEKLLKIPCKKQKILKIMINWRKKKSKMTIMN